MPNSKDISVNTRPVASQHASSGEAIIEFSSPVGGGLISLQVTPDDQLNVHVYHRDLTVSVTAGEPGEPVRSGNTRQDAALYQAARAFVTSWESRHGSQEG